MKHSYATSYTQGELTVIDCHDCGFKHLWPLPTEAEMRQLYHEEFGGVVRPGFKARKKEDENYWNLAFARRLKSYWEILGEIQAPRVLDLGCGTGNLLRFFRKQGWTVQGIEPSKQFTEELVAHEIPYLDKLTDEMTEEDWASLGKFHVVNLSMVLEHVRDPFQVIQDVVSVLLPGGILTIESPNDFNPLQIAATRSQNLPSWWINRLHINYFDFESLERLVQRVGLQPVLREAQFPMEFFLLFGDNYIGDSKLGRQIHQKRVAFEENLECSGQQDVLQNLYCSLSQLGIGRTAIVHSRKELS